MIINDPILLQQVVKYLEKHHKATHIKKMLYCLCTSRWEKDIEYLDSIKFQYLIEQAVKENSTLETFRVSLQNLIKTINKPKEYIETAKIIYLTIGQLYPEFRQEHIGQGSSVSLRSSVIQSSTSGKSTEPSHQMSTQVSPQISNQDVSSALGNTYNSVAAYQIESQIQDNHHYEQAATEAYSEPELPEVDYAEEVEYTEDWVVPEYDIFVLRQNVMSCTNPLRAKIILLVMLRPNLNFNNSMTAMMKNYQLDDLLLEVLKACHSIQQVEEIMTEAIGKMVDLEEYAKTANGLLQSFAPLYIKKPVQQNR